MKTKLNDNKIEKLPLPSTGATPYYDSTDGLVLRVSSTGSKTWNFYKWSNGAPLRKSLGRYPAVSLEDARKAARKMAVELDRGEQCPARYTIAALVNAKEQQLKAQGARHHQRPQAMFRLNWQHLADRKIDTITTLELTTHHNKIADTRGRVCAAFAIKFMRSLYACANDLTWTDKNPAKRVKVNGSQPREVFLTNAELAVFRSVLLTKSQDCQDYFNLCLLTGARRENISAMRYEDIHGDTWTIPGKVSKSGDTMKIPLLPAAVEIVERRNGSEWVFPSPKSASGHVAEPWGWLRDIHVDMRKLGVTKHFTIHDLRRTFATRLTALGVPLPVVSKALGHRRIQTTAIYARADIDTVRLAMEKLT